MKVGISLLIFFLLGVGCLSAQTNFVKGYYVTSSKDTIHGYIDYRFSRLSRQMVFKKDTDAIHLRFTPKDSIIGFAIDNRDYYENHPFKTPEGEVIQVFYRVLVHGKITLLKHEKKYYLKTEEGQIYDLTSTKVIEGKLQADLKTFGVIKVIMSDCGSINANDLEEEFKNHGSFESFIRQYNECTGSSNSGGEKIKIKPYLEVGLTGSPQFMNMRFGSALSKLKLELEPNYSAGIYTSLFIQGMNENSRLLFELTYSDFSDYGFFSRGGDNNYDLFIDFSSLRIPVYFRYNPNKLFFDVGLNQIYLFRQELLMRQERVNMNNANSIDTYDAETKPFSKWSPGVLVGAGMKHAIAGWPIYTSLRFTYSIAAGHPYKHAFQTIEFNLAIPVIK